MSIVPLPQSRVEAHDERVTRTPHQSAPHANRTLGGFLARALAPSLDRQLARGSFDGFRRVLAIRAEEIVSAAGRRELAHDWDHVLDMARRPPVPRTPRLLLCRDRIIAAEGDVREMLTVLLDARPLAVRGVAMAGSLLRDGAGPLCNRRSRIELSAAVREATRQMDPLADVVVEETGRDSEGCYR
jgi:hypothetical protein